MYDAVPGYRDKSKDQLLKLDSIDSLKCMSNHVLIRINDRHDEITHGTLTLKLDTSYEVGKHAENKGVVVKVPDKFVFPKNKRSGNDSDWDTEIEVEPGDQVWFDYLTGLECNKIECDGKLYYILPYHVLYVVKRMLNKNINPVKARYVWDDYKGEVLVKIIVKDGDNEYIYSLDEDDNNFYRIIPLNGYVLLDPIMYTDKFMDFELEREDGKYATVAYSGSCNKKYRSSQNKFGEVFYYDDPAVKEGCKVVYGMKVNLFLEQEEHSSFNGNKRYRITQRRYLTAIMEKEKVV